MSRIQFVSLLAICAAMALCGGFAGGVLIPSGHLHAQPAPGSEKKEPVVAASLHAREFVLVDDKGVRRAELNVNDAGATSFVVFDGEARERLSLTAAPNKLLLQVAGHERKPAFVLAAHDDAKDRATMFAINGVSDQPVFSVQHRGHREADKKRLEETYLGISDGKDPRVIVGHNGDDATLLAFANKKEQPTVLLTSSKDKGQMFFLEDISGKAKATLIAHEGEAVIKMIGPGHEAAGSAASNGAVWQVAKNAKLRLVAGIGEDDVARVKTLDVTGVTTWRSDAEK